MPTPHQLILRRSSKSSQQLLSCRGRADSEEIKGAIVMDSEIEGIKGLLHIMHDDLIETAEDKKHQNPADALCMFYDYEVPRGLQIIPRLLEGVNISEKIVNKDDIEETILWHERHGSSSSSRNNYMSQSRRADSVSRAQNHPPAYILKGAGHGFSLGRGKASGSDVASDNPNHQSNGVGLFRPSYRDCGSRGHQSSPVSYVPRAGTYRSYRPQGESGHNFWRPRGGAASSGDSWRSNNERRQETDQGYGGRGQGQHRGWSATKS